MNHSYALPAPAIEKLCAVLAQFDGVEKVVLFGSRAKGTARPGSDIDLALFGEVLDWRSLAALDNAIDDLMLPYEVDLVIHHRIQHPELLEHIARVGVPFFDGAEFKSTRDTAKAGRS